MIALRPKGKGEKIAKEVFRNKGILKEAKPSKNKKKSYELYKYFDPLQH